MNKYVDLFVGLMSGIGLMLLNSETVQNSITQISTMFDVTRVDTVLFKAGVFISRLFVGLSFIGTLLILIFSILILGRLMNKYKKVQGEFFKKKILVSFITAVITTNSFLGVAAAEVNNLRQGLILEEQKNLEEMKIKLGEIVVNTSDYKADDIIVERSSEKNGIVEVKIIDKETNRVLETIKDILNYIVS